MEASMKKISPFLFMMFLGSVLFADLDKHQKYGTMPIEYDPVPVFINPDYIGIYRNEVTITVGGGSWDSEISWQLDTDPAGDFRTVKKIILLK